VGDRAREHVVLQTEIRDDLDGVYTVREPRDAAELGKLYRLFLLSGFPLAISEADRHLVTVDADGQLAGGVVWRRDADAEPHLDGVVVVRYRRGRGLARVILEDFCKRLASEGHQVLRTHFSLQGFFNRLGFQLDQQRGGLVRRLR
jgi:predicted GNAT superfamily acetyltransferase